ncbi:MAG: glycoside hydrolase family 31 protein [Cellulosilyticaceae bacterium]
MIKKTYKCSFLQNEGNCVKFGFAKMNIYVYVLEEHIFRVWMFDDNIKNDKTWSIAPGCEDINVEGRDKFDVSGFSLPKYDVMIEQETVMIETSRLKAVIVLDGFKIVWYTRKDGVWRELFRDRQTQAYNFDKSLGQSACHYIERNEEEIHLGLGEKTGNVDKSINRYLMKNVDAMGYDADKSDPLYKHIPFYITKTKDRYYGLFYDTYVDCTFDLGRERDNYHGLYKYFEAKYGELDYYVIGGEDLSEVTKTFAWMGGQTIFMPKWSLGYSGSTMSYTDAPNAGELLLSFAGQCEEHDILCSSFQLSSGYTSIGDKRYVFNWNYDKVPDPKKLAQDFENAGIKLCANIKPALLIDHPQYKDLEANKMFIQGANGEAETAQFWDELGAYVDFTNPKTYEWWKKEVTEKLLEYGIASTWNDNNEFEIWDDEAKCFGFGSEKEIAYLKPVQTLLMMKASCEAQRAYAPNLRPYLISRSGCMGMQRYVQTWTGDNYTRWETLRYNSKMGIGLSLSAIYNFGHDVGGFSGPKPEEELFVRWIQHGIFMPRFTIHSWNSDQTVNEAWMYEGATPAIRDLIKLRYRLTPFFYDLMYRAHSEYEPIIRPLFYNFDDKQIDIEADEYMVGDHVMVVNIFDKGVKEKSVYLPENQIGWYDYYTGAYHKGGSTVVARCDLDYKVPMYVTANAVVAVDTTPKTFKSKHDERLALEVFVAPGKNEFKQVVFNDDGMGYGYRDNQAEWIEVRVTSSAESITIKIENKGEYTSNESLSIIMSEEENRQMIVESNHYDLQIEKRKDIF